jgi:mannose-1-phosphate guanylyltransferase
MAIQHAYAVILAGGGGTRLWPKSRNQTPKQFLKLFGTQTMVQVAAERVTKLVPWKNVIVVTNKLYVDDVRDQLPQVPTENIIAEPEKRDTAMAMLTGALFALSKDPQAIVINAASDHVIADDKEFVRVMTAATSVAATDHKLVTVGITPTFPHPGLGYIRIGDDLRKLGQGLSLFKVASFTEKPNPTMARAFISTGRYFWNANMYVWSAADLQASFAQHMPVMHQLTQKLSQLKPEQFHAALDSIYSKAESISIDYAISEKADNLVLIPGDFGWNDVGDWKVVYDLSKKDLAGNVVVGDKENIKTLTVNSHNNFIHADGRLIALVGVSDMIVVDTDEILMICPKDKSQDVKKLVERLKEESKQEYL